MLNSVLIQIVSGAAEVANQVADTVANVAAQTAAVPATSTIVIPKQDSLSLLDLIMKGGIIMIPMGLGG